jgi:3-hydroxyisobutyrate dehydrogenase
MSSMPPIFFIGVGNMGHPMAANLLKAGYPLTVFDRVKDKAMDLLEQGAYWAPSLLQGMAYADVVMSSLTGPIQVQ